MDVICLEDEAFYGLIEQVFQKLKTQFAIKEEKWISAEEAMVKLNIKSKTTLQKLRDENAIRFSQPEKRIIVYDLTSIYEYLEKHANTF